MHNRRRYRQPRRQAETASPPIAALGILVGAQMMGLEVLLGILAGGQMMGLEVLFLLFAVGKEERVTQRPHALSTITNRNMDIGIGVQAESRKAAPRVASRHER